MDRFGHLVNLNSVLCCLFKAHLDYLLWTIKASSSQKNGIITWTVALLVAKRRLSDQGQRPFWEDFDKKKTEIIKLFRLLYY